MATRFVSQSRYEWLLKEAIEGAFMLHPDADGRVRSFFDMQTLEITNWYVVPDDDPRAETVEFSSPVAR